MAEEQKSELFKLCNKCKVEKAKTEFSLKKTKDKTYKLRSYCKVCHAESTASWRKANPEKLLEFREADLPKRRKAAAEYRRINKDNPSFKAKRLSATNRRRAAKVSATPVWLSEDHKKEIEYVYWLSRDIFITSGEDYHVDHIVPLKGRNVCGLHVPWNLQILPSDINSRKSNKHA